MSERFDLYAIIHKALRHYMGAVLVQVGRLDPTDEQEVRGCRAALLDLVDWLESHLSIEQRFVHAALAERRRTALLATLEHDHEEHQRSFSMLRGDAESLLGTLSDPLEARRSRSRHLYLAVSRFVAENFLHMAIEETEMNLLLWETFTDEELFGIYQAILASEGKGQLERAVTWTLPAISHEERLKLLGGARAAMPAAAFDALLPQVRAAIGERDFEKLTRALGRTRAA